MNPLAWVFQPRPDRQDDAPFRTIDGTHYLEILDRIEAKLDPTLYLEIGSRDGLSLSRRRCSFFAIDPEFAIANDVFNQSRTMTFFQDTSDAFFKDDHLGRLGVKPDLAFIDGMHHFEFALRDFMNCERAMDRGGVICLHDVVPYTHAMTSRDPGDRLQKGQPWTGDVWKVMAILKTYRPDLVIELLSSQRTGLGVVSNLDPGSDRLESAYDDILAQYSEMTLSTYGPEQYFSDLGLKAPEELSILSKP